MVAIGGNNQRHVTVQRRILFDCGGTLSEEVIGKVRDYQTDHFGAIALKHSRSLIRPISQFLDRVANPLLLFLADVARLVDRPGHSNRADTS